MFRDRREAGQLLARRLAARGFQDPVVLALPRGGVPVGFEIAAALGAPLDVLPVRKIGAPYQPELGVGALVDGDALHVRLDRRAMERLGLREQDLADEIREETAELRRRERLYRSGRPPVAVSGRTVVLVDDGVATGSSVSAALRALRSRRPGRLVLAVPVAPAATIAALEREADEVVCLATPPLFGSVGEHYFDFEQVPDEVVIDLLLRARNSAGNPSSLSRIGGRGP